MITPDLGPELYNQVGIGDIDGDGRDDIVSEFEVQSGNSILVSRLGDPMCYSEFGPYTCPYFSVPLASDLFTIGDIDGDGRDDLARYQTQRSRSISSARPVSASSRSRRTRRSWCPPPARR